MEEWGFRSTAVFGEVYIGINRALFCFIKKCPEYRGIVGSSVFCVGDGLNYMNKET
jgi:hypothetical protein